MEKENWLVAYMPFEKINEIVLQSPVLGGLFQVQEKWI